jgi:hypothetical protein
VAAVAVIKIIKALAAEDLELVVRLLHEVVLVSVAVSKVLLEELCGKGLAAAAKRRE